MLTHASLFSGIGGFDLAAEWAGWENLFHCEWNPFGQKVLKHHFPNSISYNDITKTDFTIHRGQVDILTGGFPCQPYSTAGKRKGTEDERHLWPHMLRTIREVKPRWVVGENVRGLVSWNDGLVFHEVQSDLENEGYEVQPFLIPAAGVNAPHQRYRVWFIAYSNGFGRGENVRFPNGESNVINENGTTRNVSNTNCEMLEYRNNNRKNGRNKQKVGIESFNCTRKWNKFPTESPICRRNDGISKELDGITFSKWRKESIKAFGNAIVPQVAYQIFKAINEFELLQNK